MEDNLILVDLQDNKRGSCGKIETHRKGLLHRAFSVFIFNKDKLLVQKRAKDKYHSGGLWANSCCSHPSDGEPLIQAVKRRLMEETGIDGDLCQLKEAGSFVYRAQFSNGMTEYEFDHVFCGEYDGSYTMNPHEAEEMVFIPVDEIAEDVAANPQKYAPWFITALPIALKERR